MKKITKKQEIFLDRYTKGGWELNLKTGLVDVDGDFNCSHMELSDFMGIEFGNINGIFRCSFNRLVSLKGAPKKVGESFYCYNNQLVSLEGAPQEVGGYFYCYDNNLVSLEGAPQKVSWGLTCDAITLRGCPIDLLDKIYFHQDDESFILKDYIKMIINGLDTKIYLKKMI